MKIIITVIHNGERQRNEYLDPKLKLLITDCAKAGFFVELNFVGDHSLIRVAGYKTNTVRRIIRAMAFTLIFYRHELMKPGTKMNLKKRLLYMFSTFQGNWKTYKRPIEPEQNLMLKHLSAWKKSSDEGKWLIVLENDVIFRDYTTEALLHILRYITTLYKISEQIYVDLAGGQDRKILLNGWAFDVENDDQFRLSGYEGSIIHTLPILTINTTCGYLVSPRMSKEFMKHYHKNLALLPVDWFLCSYAVSRQARKGLSCIHTTPTVFQHGSADGIYHSSFEDIASI